ncbi:MAG TPA: purine-nucleoside phosphorylase [Spirochaetaceae bacterium]|nr:purine-nucleoside phosphorylase [Spirochaetaceae bacterium]
MKGSAIHDRHLGHFSSGTPHNAAVKGAFAPLVLMPGDPLRAQYIAETRLKNVRKVTGVRNMLGFTGSWEGKDVSVMSSGMGSPSMGIYSFELFSFYGVESIVRIGTCGGMTAAIDVGDIVIAMTASTDSNYAHQYGLNGSFSPCADYDLLEKAVASARKRDIRHWVGGIFSSDVFSLYSALPDEEGWKKWAGMGCAATDMECFALYCNAAYLGKKALTLLTCSDSNITRKEMTPEERQTSLNSMFDIALDLV